MAQNWPETMNFVGWAHSPDGQYLKTVANRATEIWREPSKARLAILFDLKAPDVIIWAEMRKFQPGRVPVASLPQFNLLEEWKDEPVLEMTKKGQMYRFQTPKGAIIFNPKGRFGPYFKVV